MYLCAELVDGVCHQWAEYESFFHLSIEDGMKIGGMLFLLSCTAWSLNFLARFLLNR